MKWSYLIALWAFFTICSCLQPVSLYADGDVKAIASVAATTEKQAVTSTSTKANKHGAYIDGRPSPDTAAAADETMGGRSAEQKEASNTKVVSVNFDALKERLKNTDAIGFFTKLAIRNDIVDLMDKIKRYRKQSMLKEKMQEIRTSFDGLLLKIIALLEEDPDLSRDLYVGRESIWESLLEVKA